MRGLPRSTKHAVRKLCSTPIARVKSQILEVTLESIFPLSGDKGVRSRRLLKAAPSNERTLIDHNAVHHAAVPYHRTTPVLIGCR